MRRPDPLDLSRNHWTEELGASEAFFALASVLRLSRRLGVTLDEVARAHGLSRNGYLVLMSLRLSRDGSMILGRLASELLVHPTTATMTVDRLELDGLVVKASDARDRRAIRVRLLAPGRRAASNVTADLAERGFGFGGLDAANIAKLTAAVAEARRASGDIE